VDNFFNFKTKFLSWIKAENPRALFLCKKCNARTKFGKGVPWPLKLLGSLSAIEESQKDRYYAEYFYCLKCGASGVDNLDHNINEVVGIIGGSGEDKRIEPVSGGKKALVTLISRDKDKACSADIDRLEIHPPADGSALDYESAVNKVLIALNEDSSRTRGLKKVPVVIHDGVELGNSVRAMLAKNFWTVEVQSQGSKTT